MVDCWELNIFSLSEGFVCYTLAHDKGGINTSFDKELIPELLIIPFPAMEYLVILSYLDLHTNMRATHAPSALQFGAALFETNIN